MASVVAQGVGISDRWEGDGFVCLLCENVSKVVGGSEGFITAGHVTKDVQ